MDADTGHVKLYDDWHIPLCRAAAETWPATDWPFWYRYNSDQQRKRTTHDPDRLTSACRELLSKLAEIPAPGGSFPDLDLHGAGMHWLRPGDHLGLHEDSERHPTHGWFRRWNAVLFLNDCRLGGDLRIDGHPLITPRCGRLVLFPPHRAHAVHPVLKGDRKSLSLFWWSVTGEGTTTEATFL